MANSAAFVGMMGGAGAGAAYTYVRLLGKRGVNGKLVIMCFSAFSCLTAAVFSSGICAYGMVQIVAMIGAGLAEQEDRSLLPKLTIMLRQKNFCV